ncbi:MAG: site-2 protease family protein [Endomicrobium sp.]|jgi:regulator of sigma E protease|nr:site-2 protease family protein [Endomicrobium sp.]
MIFLQILGIIAGLGFLIFIHELGHFIAAKMCKVRVLTFALGFGPDIFKYEYKGTKYALKAIPLGGFCAMAGENPDEFTGSEGEYLSLPWYKKIWIAFSGPFSNYILAVFLFTFLFNVWGVSTVSDSSAIGGTIENFPAAHAGLQQGDIIKSIDGVEVNNWHEMTSKLKDRAEKETTFVIIRGTHTFEINIKVARHPVTGVGAFGVVPLVEKVDAVFFHSISLGAEAVVSQSVMTVMYLADKIISWEKPDIAGPVGVMQVMAKAAKSGMEDYIKLLAVISVALGLFNLFPIPLVDGGMIILFLFEGITRRKINTKVIQVYNTIGLVLIAAVFIFATYSDLLRLGIGKLFGK